MPTEERLAMEPILTFLAAADAEGIVPGGRVPILLTSRAGSVLTGLASCAVAVLEAKFRRGSSIAKAA